MHQQANIQQLLVRQQQLMLLQQQYMTNATERGEELRAGLRQLGEDCPRLANVRGLGLMVAADVVEPGASPVLDPHGRDAVIQAAFEKGLLLLGCGESGVRFCPPLCVTSEQVRTALRLLRAALSGKA